MGGRGGGVELELGEAVPHAHSHVYSTPPDNYTARIRDYSYSELFIN